MTAQSLAAGGLQVIVNRCLELDPELAEGVAELEGSVLEVHLQGIDKRIQLHPSAAGVSVVPVDGDGQQSAVVPDVTISGPPFTLLRLLGSLESADGVLPPDVSISGELLLVQKLTRLARRANIDWEEPLSKVFGDSVAHEIGRGVRGFASWAVAAAGTFAVDMGEYLREERRLSPTRLEVDDFASRVDQTRDDVERLEFRVARLTSRTRGR
ncbi:MAG: SCP2 sterol-binding domain-containing protein [Gammaproteobacteria bacterium]|nr:MAG: SCP2 sterol-binding domain-containing protein [Gammaproteobacteria bacterium]